MNNHLFDALLGNPRPDTVFAKLHDGRVVGYGQVLKDSARFANVLISMGISKGDRVAVQVPKSIEAAILYIACVRAGAVFLPLNTAYTPAEVDYFLDNAGAALFVCDPARVDAMAEVAAKNSTRLETLGMPQPAPTGQDQPDEGGSMFTALLSASTEFENALCDGDDLAAILYTSGTTGRSKGAMLSHDNLLSNCLTLKDYWQFSADDVLLHALPIFHTHGLFVAINTTLAAGSSMIFLPSFDVDLMIDWMAEATCMMGVPTFYTRLLDAPRFTGQTARHMRVFISGSAPLLAETHVQFEERTGKRILERYGMTETNMNTSNPYDGERRAGTVGFPLPGVSLRVSDPETGKELETDEVGVLEVSGPNVFSGYWQMPDKTAEEFRDDGFFITGDLGKVDADGYVHIVGRAKDLIISGGYNIYPKEIELVLDEQEGVLESAVIGIPHPDFGEGVVAIVVPKAGCSLDPETILAGLDGSIARFKQPKVIEILNELPRNTMGKVQKNVLRDQFRDTFA